MTVNKKIIYGFLIVDIILLIVFISAIAYKRYSDSTHEPPPVKQEAIETNETDSDSDTKIRTIYFNDNILAPTDDIEKKLKTQPISKEFKDLYFYLDNMYRGGDHSDTKGFGHISIPPLGESPACLISLKSITPHKDGSFSFILEMMTDLWGPTPQGIRYIMAITYISNDEIFISKYTSYKHTEPEKEVIERINIEYNDDNKYTIDRIKKFVDTHLQQIYLAESRRAQQEKIVSDFRESLKKRQVTR